VRFVYELDEAGWAFPTVSDGSSSLRMQVGDMDDALRRLVDGVLSLFDGAEEIDVVWLEEPGAWRWTFTQAEQQVKLEISHSPYYMEGNHEWSAAAFRARAPLRDMASSIASGVEDVLLQHGVSGYRERWPEHPFPGTLLRALQNEIFSIEPDQFGDGPQPTS
jgi:hypothetical protein